MEDRNLAAAEQAFARFVEEVEPRLSFALGAAYGQDIGAEVTADALAWAWEHWEKARQLRNPAGYLYRVAQSKARWYNRPRVLFAPVTPVGDPDPAPELPGALSALTENQRVAVVLVHGLGYSEREAAEVVGLSRRSIRTHADRGLRRLRSLLGVTVDA